jgi:Flp pilus assembly pilin Flp
VSFFRDERGQGGTEYVIMLLVIVTIAGSSLTVYGSSLDEMFTGVNDKIAKVGEVFYNFTLETYERLKRNNIAFADLEGLSEYIVDEESFKDYQFVLNGEPVCVKYDGWRTSNIVDVPECEGMTHYSDTRLRLEENNDTGELRLVINPNNYKIDENCTDYHQCYNPEWEFEVVNRETD